MKPSRTGGLLRPGLQYMRKDTDACTEAASLGSFLSCTPKTPMMILQVLTTIFGPTQSEPKIFGQISEHSSKKLHNSKEMQRCSKDDKITRGKEGKQGLYLGRRLFCMLIVQQRTRAMTILRRGGSALPTQGSSQGSCNANRSQGRMHKKPHIYQASSLWLNISP